jgi:hypothetical protein
MFPINLVCHCDEKKSWGAMHSLNLLGLGMVRNGRMLTLIKGQRVLVIINESEPDEFRPVFTC